MGAFIEVRGTEALVRRFLELGADAPKAMMRAVNRTLATVKTHTVRALAQEVGLRNRDVELSIAITRATARILIGVLRVTGRRLPIGAFAPRQTRIGVSYRLPKGRGLIPSGFIATMKSGHRGVFRRAEAAGPLRVRRSGARRPPAAGILMVPRLPIIEQFGPSLPHAFVSAGISAQMERLATAELEKHGHHEIDWITRQRVQAGDGLAA